PATRTTPGGFTPVPGAGRRGGRETAAAGGRRAPDADHVGRAGGIVHGQRAVAVPAAAVAPGGAPGLPDGGRVGEDGVVGAEGAGGDVGLAGPPAGGHDVTGVVDHDAVVHGGEVAQVRRLRHVIEDARVRGDAVRVLDIERDLDRVGRAELAACRGGRTRTHLTAPGWQTRK